MIFFQQQQAATPAPSFSEGGARSRVSESVHTQVGSMIEQVMEVCGCSREAAERAVEAAGPGGELLSVDD